MILRPLARWAAPAALLATVAVTAVVIATSASRTPEQTAATAAALANGVYTARRDDDLHNVAVRFSIPLATLQRLNPRVDPDAVSIGTRLKLRR